MDLTAMEAAQLTDLSVRSTNTIFQRIRCRMAKFCATQSPFQGELEADESYFGAKRIRGKRGIGAGSKTIVFGLLKRAEAACTQKSSQTPLKPSCMPLSVAKWTPTTLFTPTVGVATMAWSILELTSISGLIMETMNS